MSIVYKRREAMIERAAEEARVRREKAATLENMGLAASAAVQRRLADSQEAIVRNLTELQLSEALSQLSACQTS